MFTKYYDNNVRLELSQGEYFPTAEDQLCLFSPEIGKSLTIS